MDAKIVGDIVHVIGVSDGRLIFVDVNSWVCSADLEKPEAIYLRHFLVPYDWFSMTGHMICTLTEKAGERTLFLLDRTSL